MSGQLSVPEAEHYYILCNITFGQCCAMCPASWHWKWQSSSLDITFTIEDGINVAVSCWVAWSFSTSDMVSARVCGPFS